MARAPFYAFPTNSDMPAAATDKKPLPKLTKLQASLAKLGLRSEMDFVLHLPMRYVDETEIAPIQQASFCGGQALQVEGVVTV